MHSYLEIADAIRQIKKEEIERMASAFEHEDFQKVNAGSL